MIAGGGSLLAKLQIANARAGMSAGMTRCLNSEQAGSLQEPIVVAGTDARPARPTVHQAQQTGGLRREHEGLGVQLFRCPEVTREPGLRKLVAAPQLGAAQSFFGMKLI
jgi:hypothetical protein